MSASVNGIRGGQPSTTQPIAGPWLSPKVVTRNRWPNVLKDMTPPQPNSSNARVYQAVVSRAFWRVKLDCASQASGTFGSLAHSAWSRAASNEFAAQTKAVCVHTTFISLNAG